MENIFRELLDTYLNEKNEAFAKNKLANKIRKHYPEAIKKMLIDKGRYKVIGSPGQGNWADCPWIAILDTLITESPQSGYYPVFLFRADMKGVYLSLNQGVTSIKEYYKQETKKVLSVRVSDFRAKISINDLLTDIELKSQNTNAKLYEAGNIVAKYYDIKDLPDNESFKKDLHYFLGLYDELIFNDPNTDESPKLNAIEKKQLKLHYRVERNSSISKQVKEIKGYKCEACDFTFESMYGELGKEFIEAHHLIPISTLELGTFKVNLKDDFAVLCSNCHSMIHKLKEPSDLVGLRTILLKQK